MIINYNHFINGNYNYDKYTYVYEICRYNVLVYYKQIIK